MSILTINDTDLTQTLLNHLTDSWKAQAIHVAAILHLPDLLSTSTKTVIELANETNCHAPSLRRLLKALVTLGICQEQENDSFGLTSLGHYLRSDVDLSLHAWSIWWGQYLWPVWGNLLYSVQTGESARTLLLGTKGFEHLANDSQAAAIFNEGLMHLTKIIANQVVKAYDFTSLHHIVDVGGGYGGLLCTILQANPHLTGVVFDQNHAKDGAEQHFATKNLADRISFCAGDFFISQSLPQGADAYLLKSVIHDWNDHDCYTILSNCRKAIKPHGRILLIDHVIPDKLEANAIHQSMMRNDLNMLSALGAQERTESEFRQLFQSVDLKITRIIPVGATFSIIEAIIK